MTASERPEPAGLVDALRRELEPTEQAIRSHPYLQALEEGRVSEQALRSFAGEQYWTLSSDRRAFAQLAARFPSPPAGDFFLSLAAGEGEALGRLFAFARVLEVDERELARYEPLPGAHAYTAFVAWLALNGSRTDVALAFLVNLPAWGANCVRMAAALRGRLGLSDADVAFFDFFATPPADFEQQALAVVAAGLRSGDAPEPARRAAHLLQAYELMYWDTLARGLEG
jgi:hypothetical protein